MAARLLPVISLLSMALPNPWSDAGPESFLQLEHPAHTVPFHAGERLQLDVKGSAESEIEIITVLQTEYWPWVLVHFDKAPKPYDAWINFAQIRSARLLAAIAPGGAK